MQMLGTKAETLQVLYGKLKEAVVLPAFSFTVNDWNKRREEIIGAFFKLDWNRKVIVRSSSLNEDTQSSSQAGKYESVGNVEGTEAFRAAVDTVAASYDDDNLLNQILVQPMLENPALCGVAFTMDPNTLGNYYVINYDTTGSTDAITSGQGQSGRLYYHFKGTDCGQAPEELRKLISTLGELEAFFSQDNLDVEFAVSADGVLYILQVRALCIGAERICPRRQQETLLRISRKIKTQQSRKPFLCGDRAVYSVMTDWNPAEMIGIRPKPLALSLYKEIITDNVWAYQRDNYGYKNLRSFPLMVDFGGLPYIDVRVSFNSFIPATLEEELSEKLVNYYLQRLIDMPEKHDKAEFDIVFSCYTLDLPERISVLGGYGFSEEEIGRILDSLRTVTNRIINHEKGLWKRDYEKLYVLERRYDEIMKAEMQDVEKVYWLIEDCKRYGTLPFAGLARAAFIAVQLLRSLVTCGILSEEDYETFMNGVNTVSSTMNRDFKEMSKGAFLKKYGHLRPGTYDIGSPRYDEAPELYFDWDADRNPAGESGDGKDKNIFKMSLEQLTLLRKKLAENGLENDVLELMDFIKIVIEGREYGKFAFTRNVSMALKMIAGIGKDNGLTKEDCGYLNVKTVQDLYSSAADMKEKLEEAVIQGKKAYQMAGALTLPPFIADEKEVFCFYYPDSEPNYITSLETTGNVLLLDKVSKPDAMSGKIILIPSADPGYDWIFSHNIKGFITMYGGANSHMAIRAGELGIPAAVGVGGKAFDIYSRASVLHINAAEKLVRIIK